MRTHHDEVNPVLSRILDDLGDRRACLHNDLGVELGPFLSGQRLIELLADFDLPFARGAAGERRRRSPIP